MALKVKKQPKPVEATPVEDGGWDIDFRIVPTDHVEPNDYNPNDMESEFFEALTNAVREEGGMYQPVLVRPKPGEEGRFLIVDGENRWRVVNFLKKTTIPVVVVPYDDEKAKVRTISFNAIRGKNIPIKLARLLVDLYKTYSKEDIRRMTGIAEDQQTSVLKLLDVPDFKPQDGIRIGVEDVDRPISVPLLLMPDELASYTTAMKKAMKLIGPDVVALIGHEVADYDKAMKGAMGIAGVKLRNVAMALICHTFANLPKDVQKELVTKAHKAIYDKAADDATAKAGKKASTDKKVA